MINIESIRCVYEKENSIRLKDLRLTNAKIHFFNGRKENVKSGSKLLFLQRVLLEFVDYLYTDSAIKIFVREIESISFSNVENVIKLNLKGFLDIPKTKNGDVQLDISLYESQLMKVELSHLENAENDTYGTGYKALIRNFLEFQEFFYSEE